MICPFGTTFCSEVTSTRPPKPCHTKVARQRANWNLKPLYLWIEWYSIHSIFIYTYIFAHLFTYTYIIIYIYIYIVYSYKCWCQGQKSRCIISSYCNILYMYITYKMYSTYIMYIPCIYIITSSTFPTFLQDLQRAGSCGRCKACSTGGTCATCKGTPRRCTSCSALGFERTTATDGWNHHGLIFLWSPNGTLIVSHDNIYYIWSASSWAHTSRWCVKPWKQ